MSRNGRSRAIALLAALAAVAAACANGDEPRLAPAGEGTSPAPTGAPSAPPSVAPAPTGAASPISEPGPATLLGTGLTSSAAFEPRPAPELADLVLPDGTAFELASLEGGPVLVFFGYTHCPDVCPATLGEIFGVFEEQPETQALFVSVDPERDTPEFLAEWTRYLPEQLYAVTGSPGAVRRAADGWGVRYARVETTSTAGYTMSHSADLYLLDEDGQLVQTYPFGTSAAQIVEDLRALDAA